MSNIFNSLYNIPVVKLMINLVFGTFVIETAIFCIKLIILLFSFLTSYLPPEFQTTNNLLWGFSFSTEEFIRAIDSLGFVIIFTIYALIEVSRLIQELIDVWSRNK